jgi:hypothetical protein
MLLLLLLLLLCQLIDWLSVLYAAASPGCLPRAQGPT